VVERNWGTLEGARCRVKPSGEGHSENKGYTNFLWPTTTCTLQQQANKSYCSLWLWICLTPGETIKSPNFHNQTVKPCEQKHTVLHKPALSGPETIQIQTGRVWLFDCESCLNRKEIIPFCSISIHGCGQYPHSMLWEIRISNLFKPQQTRKHNARRTKIINNHWHVLFLNKRTRRTCVILCRTMQAWKTCARRQEKHAPERAH
jgi:hypothetical protein